MHTFIHTYIQTDIHTYIHIYIHTYIHAYMHAYIHTYIIQSYIHTYIRTYVGTYIHTYIHTTHTYIDTYIHTYIHSHIHTYIHELTYILTYIHTLSLRQKMASSMPPGVVYLRQPPAVSGSRFLPFSGFSGAVSGSLAGGGRRRPEKKQKTISTWPRPFRNSTAVAVEPLPIVLLLKIFSPKRLLSGAAFF